MNITQENLSQFQYWLLHDLPRQGATREFIQNLYFDLPLSVILQGAPTLPPASQELLARVISQNRGFENQLQDANTLINLAEQQPILLGKTFSWAGHMNWSRGSMYSAILHVLENRSFEENIPALYTLLQFDQVPARSAGIGDVTETSEKNRQMLNKIFNASENYSHDQFHESAKDFIQYFDMSKLLNFKGASPELRQRINAAAFSSYHNDKFDQIVKIKDEFIDEKVLRNFLRISLMKPTDTTNAKTQKEKNANILPMSYTKARDALLRLVEKEEIHDRYNYGKPKTLTQRFKELIARMNDVKSWEQVNLQYAELTKDVYRKVVQRDIINGRAADLTPDELLMVARGDQDTKGFYIRHIPDNLLKDLMPYLNKTQRTIIDSRHAENAERVVASNTMSLSDKREVLKQLSHTVEKEASTNEARLAELAEYESDYAKVSATGQDYQNAFAVYTDMSHLQQAFSRIRDNFKDGKPNNEEKHLSPAALEQAIYDYITGASNNQIAKPEQRSLPIFGRGTERDRRERLDIAIRDFNRVLQDIRGKSNKELSAIWSKYRGKILDSDSLSAAATMMNNADYTAKAQSLEFQRMHSHRSRETIESEIKKYDSKKETLSRAKSELETRQEKLRDLSKRHLGKDQTGELIPVTEEMTPEEKRLARQKNKTALQDKLAIRKKKPAHTLAEMLENADMDR